MRRSLLLAAVLLGLAGCEMMHEHDQMRADMAKLHQHRPRSALCKSGDGKVSCACEQKCVQTARGCDCQDPP